jgi:hypothetical protein
MHYFEPRYMSRVYGARPRPRVLLEGVPEQFLQGYRDRFPTVETVKNRSEVDQAEFDVLVTTHTARGSEDHLRVIVFSGPTERGVPDVVDVAASRAGDIRFNVEWFGNSKAREFHVPAEWPPEVIRFIHDRLIPIATRKERNPVLIQRTEALSVISPFLQTARGEILAGRFSRLSRVDCWALPSELLEYGAECTAIAVGLWRKQDVGRFPEPLEDWAGLVRWQTVEEESAATELNHLREMRVQMLDRLQVNEDTLGVRLSEARGRADAAERLLLTAQGDDLVHAVRRCLEEFGFEVQYMDDVWAPGGRLEDLRVRLPAEPKWIAIAEVRGYKNGAAVNDLGRLLARFRTRYLQETGTLPSCSWYIANAFIPEDPAMRPAILHSNDAEVETFGEDDGLAIGTVCLFDMQMDLRRRRLTPDEAQGLLSHSRGRLKYERRPNE